MIKRMLVIKSNLSALCIKTSSASTREGLFSSDILIGLITNKTSNCKILNFTFGFQKVTGNTKGLHMRY